MSDEPWVIRAYEPDDENCVVSTWLKSYARSSEVRAWLSARQVDIGIDPRRWYTNQASPEEIAEERFYGAFHRPMVLGLLRGCETRVLCDPERVHSTPDAPSCIWAWACLSPGMVHYVIVKQEVIRTGQDIACEMVASLLSDRLTEPQTMTFEQRELLRLGLVPATWKLDASWRHGARLTAIWLHRQPAALRVASIATLRGIADEREAYETRRMQASADLEVGA